MDNKPAYTNFTDIFDDPSDDALDAAEVATAGGPDVVAIDGRFYYHAWAEVMLQRWVGVDPTLGQFPTDATHLRLVTGGRMPA